MRLRIEYTFLYDLYFERIDYVSLLVFFLDYIQIARDSKLVSFEKLFIMSNYITLLKTIVSKFILYNSVCMLQTIIQDV